ncbi:MAG: motility associated factor glycosyltransferase family protein [Helicobacter sp.]|uniref:6-hydroxymethylpterin diphosphokinase MptE-like protein n=1 Tax=Helicobacter sp. TaxID=218 RepID=UPI0025BEF4A8|nr:6-hydroxymethylpterin diphosphokinase MptE-like protein [Helicobacter sp.]MCH5313386.1 motility associated factor glycosyltransferase family protein [Helicobacter sp.]
MQQNTDSTPSLLHICQSGDIGLLESYTARRYALNMDFFSSLNHKLFAKLKAPIKQYNLYLHHQDLNIIDVHSKIFVYPVQEHNNAPKHMMIEQNLALCENPPNNPAYTIYTNHLALHKLDEHNLPLTASACNPMIELMLKDFNGANRFHLPSYFLPNLTIFGLLGGMFLQFLLEKGYYFHSLLLFEEDIDLFRISLYFVDYPLLFERVSERSCYIFVENIVQKEFVQNYFTHKRITNNFLRLELCLYESPKLQQAQDEVAQSYAINARGWGSFDDEMIGVRNTFKNLGKNKKSKYPLLHLPKRINAPICVIGNGASLDSLLPFIKENEQKMIIFSCGTALKPLKNAGIMPDFQIEIERIAYLKDVLESAPLENTTLLCGNMVQPSALEIAKEAYIFMRGGSASAYFGNPKSVVEFAAPYVGNAGFALACLLSEEVIMCGLDCGYIKGKTKHAQGSYYGDEESMIPKNAYVVQGNSEYEVYADALFSLSSAMMSKAINAFTPKLVMNLGDGAYVRGTRSTRTDEFILREINKEECIQNIKSYMCADKKKLFTHKQSYKEELNAYKEEILKALRKSIEGQNHSVANKQELFARIDTIHALSLQYSAKIPFVGVLFEGSVSHMLHTMMLCALHIPSDNIALFYARCVEIIESALNKMVMSYTMLCVSNGIEA